MSIEERAKAVAKNVEGKVQEAAGNITGDPAQQAKGQAKQTEANIRQAKEDTKEAVENNS